MEKEIKIINASELLANRKAIKISDIMCQFQGEHNLSRTEVTFISIYMCDDTKLQLFNLGFKYRTHLSPIGETCHVISLT